MKDPLAILIGVVSPAIMRMVGNLDFTGMINGAIVSAIGAAVAFFVNRLLKKLTKK